MFQADVIVNSTTQDFSKGGAIAEALYGAGGLTYQDEYKRCGEGGGMQHGDLVMTSGGNIPCKHVYHGSMMMWDGRRQKAEKVCRLF